MRWTPAARAASDVPDWRCIRHQSKRGGVRDEGYYRGVGPGKAGVLGAWSGRARQGGAEETGLARQAPGTVRAVRPEPGGDGSLFRGVVRPPTSEARRVPASAACGRSARTCGWASCGQRPRSGPKNPTIRWIRLASEESSAMSSPSGSAAPSSWTTCQEKRASP